MNKKMWCMYIALLVSMILLTESQRLKVRFASFACLADFTRQRHEVRHTLTYTSKHKYTLSHHVTHCTLYTHTHWNITRQVCYVYTCTMCVHCSTVYISFTHWTIPSVWYKVHNSISSFSSFLLLSTDIFMHPEYTKHLSHSVQMMTK